MRRRSVGAALAAGALSRLAPAVAKAQPAWPVQAVRIIVPFPPGGTADSVPRIVAEALRPVWRQPILIENRPGAGGNIGTALVANAEPDGHTLLASPPPPIAINQHLYANIPFDPAKLKAVSVWRARRTWWRCPYGPASPRWTGSSGARRRSRAG